MRLVKTIVCLMLGLGLDPWGSLLHHPTKAEEHRHSGKGLLSDLSSVMLLFIDYVTLDTLFSPIVTVLNVSEPQLFV